MNYDIEDLFEYFFNGQDYQRNYPDSAIDVIHSSKSLLSLLSLFLFYYALSLSFLLSLCLSHSLYTSLSFLQLSLYISHSSCLYLLSLFSATLSLSASLFLSIFILFLCVSQVDFLCSHKNTKIQKHEKKDKTFLK